MEKEQEKLEKRNEVVDNQTDDTTVDYISAIKEIKENSVDRSKYDQLRTENKRLLDSLVNGTEVNIEKQEEKRDITEIRDSLFNNENSNLSYIKNALDLRNTLIENGEPDPFLPIGSQIMPTDSDIQTAEKVANVLQECVDYADGDSAVFTNELQRRMVDVKIR